ncbi:MAG: hypothetical protein LBH80_02880 [Prevotellaceae bacterium]|jgi:hypothetical protein|nr:hypothetical protein [Prevotellaceae bacterium]
MKTSFYLPVLLLFFSSLSADAQIFTTRVKRSMFHREKFSLNARKFPLKILAPKYRTYQVKIHSYRNVSAVDTLGFLFLNCRNTAEHPDITINLYGNRILQPEVTVVKENKRYRIYFSCICPVTFNIYNKKKEKIDGGSVDNGKSWVEKYQWKSDASFADEGEAMLFFDSKKDSIYNLVSDERIKASIPDFVFQINNLYGYKAGEKQSSELLCVKKKDENDYDVFYRYMKIGADILSSIDENTDITKKRAEMQGVINLYKHEIKAEYGPLFFIKNHNLMLIYFYLEMYDEAIEHADKIHFSKKSAPYKKEAEARKKELEKYGLKSYCFPVE